MSGAFLLEWTFKGGKHGTACRFQCQLEFIGDLGHGSADGIVADADHPVNDLLTHAEAQGGVEWWAHAVGNGVYLHFSRGRPCSRL